jgi:hypothetical protein
MQKKRTRRTLHQRPALRLAAEFVAPGTRNSGRIDSLAEFTILFSEARDVRLRQQWRELRERQRRFAAFPKVGKVLRKYLSEEIAPEEAARRIRKICPDDGVARAALDFFTAPPPSAAASEKQLAVRKAEIDRSERILKSWKEASRHIEILASYANAGEPDAVKDLVELGHHAVQFLMFTKLTHPDVVRVISRSKTLWPLLVSTTSSWQKSAAQQLKGLELGKDLEVFQVRFEEARGADENYPARQWAKAAVRAIEETRWRFLTYGQYRDEFQQIVFAGRAALAKMPLWAGQSCRLGPLSKKTAPAWAKVMREMIRQQAPNFHTLPEWINQRRTAARSGRDTVGEIQNAILDDMASALKRIAPGCRNSPAEIEQAKKEKLRPATPVSGVLDERKGPSIRRLGSGDSIGTKQGNDDD